MGMCAFTWNRVIWPLLLFQHDLRYRQSVILSLRCVCCQMLLPHVRLWDIKRERVLLGKLYKCIQILDLLCLE